MSKIDRSTLSATALSSVDALIASAGDLDAAASALGCSKDALRGRVRRMPFTIEDILSSSAPAKRTKSTSTKTAAQAPRAAGEPYVRKDGPVKILTGGMREISVAKDHPGAVAAALTKELGGTAKADKTGLRLCDGQGREFATLLTGKTTCDFYVRKVSHADAVAQAPELGDWSYCWPTQKTGAARLVKVAKVTKGMIRSLMKLHAAHSVDRRKKEHRASA